MKKLMFTAAAALCATVGFAIESANTVGYSTKEAQQGVFIILGAQFDNVDGARKINGSISGMESVYYDDEKLFQTTAAQVQVPSANGYNTYYYLADGYYEDENGDDAYAAGWCDGDGNLVDAETVSGIAMWLRSTPGNATANVAGAVPDDDEVEVSCPTVFALRANAFPMAITVNSNTMASDDIVGVYYDDSKAFQLTASQIQVPSANGYNTYYYLSDGYYEDENGDDAYAAGWCDGDGNLVSTVIPVAQGFWTKGVSGAFTLKFTK